LGVNGIGIVRGVDVGMSVMRFVHYPYPDPSQNIELEGILREKADG
jgi:hypothetical protein